MRVLVTGGAGYIGSHTCKALAQAGHTPVVLDNLSTGYRSLVRWGDFIHGDIRNTPLLASTMRQHSIEGVIHFAAFSCVGDSVTHPGLYYHNNVVGTHSILEAMGLAGVKHIVVSSTCAVYGLPPIIPMDETTPQNPINPYGATKSMMERMLADYHGPYGLHSAALRYFNAAGCDAQGETGEWHVPETHLIPRVLMAAFGDIPALHIFGNDYPTPDGTCIRDYIHVADLASAHVLALEHLLEHGGVLRLNLGTGSGFSVQEIIQAAHNVLGKPVPHTMGPRRPGDPPALVAQAALANETLGWVPRTSQLDHILHTAAEWYAATRQKNAL